MSESETRILLRTFLAVFPRAQVWRGDFSADRPALALVGAVGDDAFAPDPVTIRRRLGELRPDPTNPQLVDPAGVWMNHVGLLLPEDLGTGDGDNRINSEDRPWIELTGPLRHAGRKGAGYFVGRPLQRWLSEVRERSRDRLPGTGAEEREAWRAGDLLFEFSLLLWEGRAGEAAKVREQLARVLPPAVYSAVFGGP